MKHACPEIVSLQHLPLAEVGTILKPTYMFSSAARVSLYLLIASLLVTTPSDAKGEIQPWALMRYDTDQKVWVVQEIYETKAECEQWRQTQTGGVYACVKAVKKIPPPPDHVEIP